MKKSDSLVFFKSKTGIGVCPSANWNSVMSEYNIVPILYSILISDKDTIDEISNRIKSALKNDEDRDFEDIVNNHLSSGVSQN